MKHFLLIVLLTVPFVCKSQFRKTNWGMTKEAVQLSEDNELIVDRGKMLIYKGTIDNLDTYIIYSFDEGLLSSGSYSIKEEFVNDNNYIIKFEDLKEQLTAKYGDPSDDEMIWKNNLYKDDPDKFGMAISAGHLEYRTTYKTEDSTIIVLSLKGEKYKCDLGIMYVNLSGIREKKTAEGL